MSCYTNLAKCLRARENRENKEENCERAALLLVVNISLMTVSRTVGQLQRYRVLQTSSSSPDTRERTRSPLRNRPNHQPRRGLLLRAHRQLHRDSLPSLVRHPTPRKHLSSSAADESREVERVHRRRSRDLAPADCLHIEELDDRVACRCEDDAGQNMVLQRRTLRRNSPLRLSNAVSANVSVAVAPVLSRSHSVANVA